MSNREELLTPVGRLVQGSLYTGQTTDAENRPLVYKTGPNAGQPRVDFYFALAIPKGTERHWAETVWGAKIWAVGHAGFPNGQADSPAFAWKITDGDSAIPNRKGNKPCDREGYPGNWVLSFSSGFAPTIYNENGTEQLLQPNHVKLGDYIQVYGSVADNESQQQPGVFLNHQMVAFAAYGKRIVAGADPKAVGFGNSALPAGASATPLDGSFNPGSVATPAPLLNTPPPPAYMAPPASTSAPVPPPYPGILTPPAAPTHVLTAKAGGASYEQLIGAGWTHALLIQHGYIQV